MTDTDRRWRRRQLLSTLGLGSLAGVTGCLRFVGTEQTSTATTAETATPKTGAATPTEAESAPPTETSEYPTSGPERVDHVFVDSRNTLSQRGATVSTVRPLTAIERPLDLDYDSRVSNGPVVAADTLVVQTVADGVLGLSKADGTVEWRLSETGADPYRDTGAPIALDGDTLVTVLRNRRTDDTRVVGIDPTTGQVQFAVVLPLSEATDEYVTAGKTAAGKAYAATTHRAGDGESTLYAVDLAGGDLEWRARLGPGDLHPEDIAIDGDTLVVTTDEAPAGLANVVAFDLAARERRWARTLAIGEGVPVLDDDHVYLPNQRSERDDRVLALSRADGSVAWAFEQLNAPRTGVTVDGDHVYSVTNDRVYAISPADGTPIWSYARRDGPPFYGGSGQLPVATQNCLLVGSWTDEGAQIRAIRTDNGELAWRIETTHEWLTSPFVAGQRLWAIGHDGRSDATLYAFEDR